MPNDNEKLARFEKAVTAEVESKTTEILSEVDSYKEEKLVDIQETEIQRAYDTIQRKAGEIRAAFARDVTKERLAARQRVLSRRSELTREMFARAAGRVTEFAKTDAYREKLKALLGRHEGEQLHILVRAEDEELVRSLAKDAAVEVSPAIQLGGLIFYSENTHLYEDETYDTLLKQAEEDFYNSGKADLSKLEGVGDFA